MKKILYAILLALTPGLMALTTFDRIAIIDAEGYWAGSPNIERDSYGGQYPFPQPYDQPWEGKREFLDKLYKIEASACPWIYGEDNSNKRIVEICYKGMARSRLEQGVWAGSREYRDTQSKIRWTQGFSYYYVEKFNVKPSQQFYDYVMNFEFIENI